MKKVLILSSSNSARSLIAEGLWRCLGHGEWDVVSAGARPSGTIDPTAAIVMKEAGIDIDNFRSKSISEFNNKDFDLVVTVCDRALESCANYPMAKGHVHWEIDDLSEAPENDATRLVRFRCVREAIRDHITYQLADRRPLVLFVCNHNSSRSQMAEGILRSLAGERFEAASAGIRPKRIARFAVSVMAEAGMDISGQRPKSLDEFVGKVEVSYPIIVCEKKDHFCPTMLPFSSQVLHWPIFDPSDQRYAMRAPERFRSVRDQLHEMISAWLEQFAVPTFKQLNSPGSFNHIPSSGGGTKARAVLRSPAATRR